MTVGLTNCQLQETEVHLSLETLIYLPHLDIVFPIKRNSRGEHPAALKLPLLP